MLMCREGDKEKKMEIKVKIKVKGVEIEVDKDDLKELYEFLDSIFSKSTTWVPYYPTYPYPYRCREWWESPYWVDTSTGGTGEWKSGGGTIALSYSVEG